MRKILVLAFSAQDFLMCQKHNIIRVPGQIALLYNERLY
jgi:hypothetical protein